MLSSPRLARFLGPLTILLVAGLAGCGGRRDDGGGPEPPQIGAPAPFTPSSPAVDRLRTAAEEANVVLVIIDAARADHVGCYGYPRETTPNIDRLASDGYLFENYFVQFVETKPSTASVFTSQYPDTHLAYHERMLPESTFTLAQGFGSAGYHTVLFSQNEYASPLWGLGLHFDEAFYEPHIIANGRQKPYIWEAEAVLELIEPWLEKSAPEPFFAYIHFIPPHDPYLTPLDMYYKFYDKDPPNAWRSPYPFDEVEQELRQREKPWSEKLFINRYDSHLLYADWAVGKVEEMLREAGLFENTLFIVTSDHGEAFGEHGYKGHTISAYDETTHVPLVMRFPGSGGPTGRVPGLTQAVDLLPTLLDLLQIPYPSRGVQGRSLLSAMAGEEGEVNDYIFCRTAGKPPSYAVRDHRSLLILYQGGELRALYDLEKDPRAVENTIDEQPERAAELLEAFRAFAETQVAPPLDYLDPDAPTPELPEVQEVEVTEEMERTLRALGYLK
jgi:arylsulfatase A-like enzyme